MKTKLTACIDYSIAAKVLIYADKNQLSIDFSVQNLLSIALDRDKNNQIIEKVKLQLMHQLVDRKIKRIYPASSWPNGCENPDIFVVLGFDIETGAVFGITKINDLIGETVKINNFQSDEWEVVL